MTTTELLSKLINGRPLRVRLTRKQFNWLQRVADEEVTSGSMDVIRWEPSQGAIKSGHSDVATIYETRLNGERVLFKREFNGSGIVYQ